MPALARLVVAAPSTGSGKTTIAVGLMAALRLAGYEVSGHKIGPDFIDPGYHTLATGRPGRNLDPHLVGEDRVVPLLLHGAAGADVAIIEGVMGLFDGRLGTDGFASTAHVAHLTRSPVVVVIDVARMSRTAAAIATGMGAFDPRIDIAAVILNRTGSARNDAEIVAAMECTGIPVLGLLPHDENLTTPSRHLGLVPAEEREDSVVLVEALGHRIGDHLDLAGLLKIAGDAPDLEGAPWNPKAEVSAVATGRPVIAMAGGRAFTFRYPETEELLRASGCTVVTFDPTSDVALPEGTQGIYLGGGFPQVHSIELAGNHRMLDDLATAVESGIPTVAECAGLLYLCESLDGLAMAGAVSARAAMTEHLTLRYPVAIASSDSLLTRSGEQVTGHEFHRTRTTPTSGTAPAWQIDGTATGFTTATLHASYLHVHWAGHPHLAERFAAAAARTAPHDSSAIATGASLICREHDADSGGPAEETPDDPLRYHGDAETADGLLDLAVNVFDGPRPQWLETALTESLRAATAYPNVEPARAALAQRHGCAITAILPTAGAAEAFTLVARLRQWRRPVVVHPQFTEPHAALELAGHSVTPVLCRPENGFVLDPDDVPADADLVVIGNPTNPTGVLHPAALILRLLRPGRLVVVDEAFMDVVPDEGESLAPRPRRGLLVVRSLTKHWSIPGIRAGYVIGHGDLIAHLQRGQAPWSVSTPAAAAMIACSSRAAGVEGRDRALTVAKWRGHLEAGLGSRSIPFVSSRAPFVLARTGDGSHRALRDHGIAVRRADTFPGLDGQWVRIAVRHPATTSTLFTALDDLQRAGAGTDT